MRALFTAMTYQALTEGSGSDRRARGRRGGFATGRRGAVAAIGGIVCLMLLAGTAQASVFEAAPGYPNSTLAIDVAGKPRAGKVVKLTVSGSNAPFEIGYPGSGDFLSYQLDAFAQNAKVLPNCPRSFREELQNEVNLGISRIAQGLNEGYFGSFGIPLAFQASRSVRAITVCAYSRMISDDAAVSAVAFKLRAPRCSCRRH